MKELIEDDQIYLPDAYSDVCRLTSNYTFKICNDIYNFFESNYYEFFCRIFSIKTILNFEYVDNDEDSDIYINKNKQLVLFNNFYFDNTQYYKKRSHMIILLSQTCKNNCTYCVRKKDEELPTLEQIDKFLLYLKDLEQISEISISGGEPTLSEYLDYFIDIVSKMNKTVNSISTSNIKYHNKLIKMHHYHFIKNIENNKILTPNNRMISFKIFNQFLETFLKNERNSNSFINGVLTEKNLNDVLELFESVDNKDRIIFRTERTNELIPKYRVSASTINHIPKKIIKQDLIFYIRNVVLRQWITYNISSNEVYLNSSHIPII